MSSAAIRALVSGYPRRLWGEKLLVMLQAYVDDSVGRTGDKRLFLAAYVLTADQWIQFTDAWDAGLRDEPAIPYFHMTEANGRGGPFRKFSVHQRNKKVYQMARVVRNFAPHGLHVSVSTSEFDQILRPYVPYAMQTPYFVLCYAIILGLARLHEQLGLSMSCDVIFDDHPGLAARVLPIFDLMSVGPEAWRKLIGGKPAFRDDKEVLPLQAADLLAWHERREWEGVPAKDYENVLDMLTVNKLHYVNHMNPEVLHRLADGFKAIPTMQTLIRKKDWDEVVEVAVQAFHAGGYDTLNSLSAAADHMIKHGLPQSMKKP